MWQRFRREKRAEILSIRREEVMKLEPTVLPPDKRTLLLNQPGRMAKCTVGRYLIPGETDFDHRYARRRGRIQLHMVVRHYNEMEHNHE